MRQYVDLMDLHPSLIGTLSVIGGTAIGAPVDTLGFKDVLAVLCAGAVFGSGSGSTIYLDVKIQESATATGTGASWSDIGTGVNGTFDFDQITISGTDPGMVMEKQYAHAGDGVRKRYYRAHATLTGTVGLGPKVCVAFLLGRANDSGYIVGAETQGTGNIHYTKLL